MAGDQAARYQNMKYHNLPILLLSLVLIAPGCSRPPRPASSPPAPPASTQHPLFQDVAAQAGIRFTETNGADGHFRFDEFSPGGCALFDYDNDGYPDILLIQSGPSDPQTNGASRPHCALYHNNGNGTFTDVTGGSGLDRDLGYAQGVAVGDYDNDGYEDLFITAFGGNHLLHNEHGTGRFTDVTHRMGLDKIHSTGYTTSAAFGDYDNDGRLDLYVCYYAPWTPAQDKSCLNAAKLRDYCSPELYPPDTHVLYHNDGDHFTDVSAKAGIAGRSGRGLAVAFVDYDGDGRQDIFVANDMTPNMLWHNDGNGRFTNAAERAGTAYGEDGVNMAGMGVAPGDYDHSGRESLFVSNFSGLPNMLFKNLGQGIFKDASSVSGVALPHLKFLAFGCAFMDYDADGFEDLLVANGSVYVHADSRMDGATYRERKQLFHNEAGESFREVTDVGLLGDLGTQTVSRGLAIGDFDNDGRLDALVNNQNGAAQLFRNMDSSGNHWVSFKTIGVKSNRDGMHARFTLTAGGVRQTTVVRTGYSYLSASDRRVYFGLGHSSKIEKVEIRWPSGVKDTLRNVAPDASYVVTEGKGITGTLPQSKAHS
jgi:hypothetical protein